MWLWKFGFWLKNNIITRILKYLIFLVGGLFFIYFPRVVTLITFPIFIFGLVNKYIPKNASWLIILFVFFGYFSILSLKDFPFFETIKEYHKELKEKYFNLS